MLSTWAAEVWMVFSGVWVASVEPSGPCQRKGFCWLVSIVSLSCLAIFETAAFADSVSASVAVLADERMIY